VCGLVGEGEVWGSNMIAREEGGVGRSFGYAGLRVRDWIG